MLLLVEVFHFGLVILILFYVFIKLKLLEVLVVILHFIRVIFHLTYHLGFLLQHHWQILLINPCQHCRINFTCLLRLIHIHLSFLMSLLELFSPIRLLLLIQILIELHLLPPLFNCYFLHVFLDFLKFILLTFFSVLGNIRFKGYELFCSVI